MHRHLSEEELIAALYDAGAEVDACPECRGRIEELAAVRSRLLEVPVAAQPGRIQVRLERRVPRLAPALAAGCLAALGFLLQAPAPPAEPDSQLLAEVYALARSPEPSAVQPIRALFEGK